MSTQLWKWSGCGLFCIFVAFDAVEVALLTSCVDLSFAAIEKWAHKDRVFSKIVDGKEEAPLYQRNRLGMWWNAGTDSALALIFHGHTYGKCRRNRKMNALVE